MGLIAGSNAGNLTLTQDIQALKEKVEGLCPGGVISDAFSQEKDYSVGDYCIYLNGLYKFIDTKPAGPWDGSKVVPVSVSDELSALNSKFTELSQITHISEMSYEWRGGNPIFIIADGYGTRFYVNINKFD